MRTDSRLDHDVAEAKRIGGVLDGDVDARNLLPGVKPELMRSVRRGDAPWHLRLEHPLRAVFELDKRDGVEVAAAEFLGRHHVLVVDGGVYVAVGVAVHARFDECGVRRPPLERVQHRAGDEILVAGSGIERLAELQELARRYFQVVVDLAEGLRQVFLVDVSLEALERRLESIGRLVHYNDLFQVFLGDDRGRVTHRYLIAFVRYLLELLGVFLRRRFDIGARGAPEAVDEFHRLFEGVACFPVDRHELVELAGQFRGEDLLIRKRYALFENVHH